MSLSWKNVCENLEGVAWSSGRSLCWTYRVLGKVENVCDVTRLCWGDAELGHTFLGKKLKMYVGMENDSPKKSGKSYFFIKFEKKVLKFCKK